MPQRSLGGSGLSVADQAKLDNITVTAAVDLDEVKSRFLTLVADETTADYEDLGTGILTLANVTCPVEGTTVGKIQGQIYKAGSRQLVDIEFRIVYIAGTGYVFNQRVDASANVGDAGTDIEWVDESDDWLSSMTDNVLSIKVNMLADNYMFHGGILQG